MQQNFLGCGFTTCRPVYVPGVKSLKQNNMPVFVISSKIIYYIVILQILSNLFLNGQNVSDTVLTVITNNNECTEVQNPR